MNSEIEKLLPVYNALKVAAQNIQAVRNHIIEVSEKLDARSDADTIATADSLFVTIGQAQGLIEAANTKLMEDFFSEGECAPPARSDVRWHITNPHEFINPQTFFR